MKRTSITLLLSALALCPATSWPQSPSITQAVQSHERQALFPSRALLEHGEKVAGTACADCHGLDGISRSPGIPHLAGQRAVYLYRVLNSYQARERRNDVMNHEAGFLNDEALLAVAAYYAGQVPAAPSAPGGETAPSPESAGDPFADLREAMKKCVRCHGEDGNAAASGMPNLSAQSPAYFVTSMKAYTDGDRDHKMMKRLVADLDDETLERMGVFYAVQEPARTETRGEGDVDLGRIASEPCASCHGADGNAVSDDMPSLAGQDARYFVKAMQAYRDGKRRHQPMFDAADSLSDDDLENLAAYYAVQEPVRRNVRRPLTSTEWIERCERCHGIDGNSSDPRFPMLAAQDRTYLSNALRSYGEASRDNSVMHAMSAPLSEGDIRHIVDYYSSARAKSVMYIDLPCNDTADN